jgi:capsular polysaccharide biosynthesis protein
MGATQDADANDWPSDGEQTVTDRDQTLIFSLNGDNSQPERFGSYDDFTSESQPADFAPGLVSLGFIKAAVRRSALFVSVAALAGLILGLGAYTATPHHYQASATILLTHGPYEDVQTAANNNQALAQTRTVAASAEHDLGLQQSVSSFLSTYTVTAITDRVLVITASAPTASQAVQRASAVGGAFLTFRAAGMQDEQNLVVQSLDQQVKAAQQRVSAINAQISKLSGGVDAAVQQPEISGLQAQLKVATSALGSLEQAVTNSQTTTLPAMTAALKGSQVLSVAALPRSKLKPLATYALVGLIAGLALSLGLVLVRALVSDRLRQRDDIAYALGNRHREAHAVAGHRVNSRALDPQQPRQVSTPGEISHHDLLALARVERSQRRYGSRRHRRVVHGHGGQGGRAPDTPRHGVLQVRDDAPHAHLPPGRPAGPGRPPAA